MKTVINPLSLLLVMIFLFAGQRSAAQAGSVGIGTLMPDSSSILEIKSTSKGILLPRMTAAQKNSIALPADGLLIYLTDSVPGFYYYRSGWRLITTSTGFANDALSNLASPTAVNADIVPGLNGTKSIGSASLAWKDFYLSGDIYVLGNRFISTRGNNNFIGSSAGNVSVTGSYNTATGQGALVTNISGNWNTANGFTALNNANNAYSNTGIGFQALLGNTTGSYNTGVGVLSLGVNATGASNSAFGVAALNNQTSGSYNVATGYFAGASLPNGSFNTYLGSYADGNPPLGTILTNATAIGYNTVVTASNAVRIGNTSVTSIGGQVGWTTISDGRMKKNIQENVPGLQFINQLRPVTYNLDVDGIDKALRLASSPAIDRLGEITGKKQALSPEEVQAKQEKAALKFSGFIAQEVEAAANKLNYSFSGVDAPKDANGLYGLRYTDFVVPLVKAVQELSKKTDEIESLRRELEAQKGELAALKESILKLEKK